MIMRIAINKHSAYLNEKKSLEKVMYIMYNIDIEENTRFEVLEVFYYG